MIYTGATGTLISGSTINLEDYKTLKEIADYYLISKKTLKTRFKRVRASILDSFMWNGYKNLFHIDALPQLSRRTYTREVKERSHVLAFMRKVEEQQTYKRMQIYCTIAPRYVSVEDIDRFHDLMRDVHEHLTHEATEGHTLIYSIEDNSEYYDKNGERAKDRKANVTGHYIHCHFVCTAPIHDLARLREELEEICVLYFEELKTDNNGRYQYNNSYEYHPVHTLDLQHYDHSYKDQGQQYVIKNFLQPNEVETRLILK